MLAGRSFSRISLMGEIEEYHVGLTMRNSADLEGLWAELLEFIGCAMIM
jgi:hypothetical protein